MKLISLFNQYNRLENSLNVFLKNNFNISLNEYLLMKYLLDTGNNSVSIHDLKENIQYKSANMSVRVKRMSSQGLLNKGRSNIDERIVNTNLTPLGIQIIRNILSSNEWNDLLNQIDRPRF